MVLIYLFGKIEVKQKKTSTDKFIQNGMIVTNRLSEQNVPDSVECLQNAYKTLRLAIIESHP